MVSGGNIKLFADDTNIFVTGKTLKELKEEANGQIILIDKWLTANKLHLNMEKKTCYTVFSPWRKRHVTLCFLQLKLNLHP